jgi:hypothetical protein
VAQVGHTVPVLDSLQDLSQYLGTYPCSNGLLHSPVLLNALAATLKKDYAAYREHMSESGCGAIERRGGYILMDVSQLHVGGYGSVILVRRTDGVVFVYWLRSTVAKGKAHIYGPRPVPAEALAIFAHDESVGWGHVACFTISADTIVIDMTRRANQDTGKCITLERQDLAVATIAIDDDSASVRTRLGPPLALDSAGYHYRDLGVFIKHSKVAIISLTGPSLTTARGLRVGDPASRTTELYHPCLANASLVQVCYNADSFDERAITVELNNGVVKRINIGRIVEP